MNTLRTRRTQQRQWKRLSESVKERHVNVEVGALSPRETIAPQDPKSSRLGSHLSSLAIECPVVEDWDEDVRGTPQK